MHKVALVCLALVLYRRHVLDVARMDAFNLFNPPIRELGQVLKHFPIGPFTNVSVNKQVSMKRYFAVSNRNSSCGA
jgi:hypothetical protein